MSNEWLDYQRERREENRRMIKEYPFLEVTYGNNDVCWFEYVPMGWQETVFRPMLPRLKEIYDVLPFSIMEIKEKWGTLSVFISYVTIENYEQEMAYDKLFELLTELRDKSRYYCAECGKKKRVEDELYCKECYELIQKEKA